MRTFNLLCRFTNPKLKCLFIFIHFHRGRLLTKSPLRVDQELELVIHPEVLLLLGGITVELFLEVVQSFQDLKIWKGWDSQKRRKSVSYIDSVGLVLRFHQIPLSSFFNCRQEFCVLFDSHFLRKEVGLRKM